MIIKTFNFRLYPNKEQIPLLKQHAGNTRFLWNKLVELCNLHKKETTKYPNRSRLQQYIIQIKQDHEFLKISHSQPLQINALRLKRTISHAFKKETIQKRKQKIALAFKEPNEELRRRKLLKAYNFGFPKFHRKSNRSDSIYYPQNFEIKKYKIYFAKLGWFNFKKHRNLEGVPKTATIIQDGEHWYLSVTCKINKEYPLPPPLNEDKIIGVDVGIKNFAVFSDGTIKDNPRILSRYQKRIGFENERLSRKQVIETVLSSGKSVKRSSKRRDKQCLKLYNLYRKCRNVRKDFLHKLSHDMITKYDGIILETLDIQKMLENNPSAVNRATNDVSWFEFGRILEYKCLWNGKHFIKINKYEPSTQKCNICKHLVKLSLDERIYKCEHCGNIEDRDINASKNIKEEGLKILRNTVGTTGINARLSKEKREKRRSLIMTGSSCL